MVELLSRRTERALLLVGLVLAVLLAGASAALAQTDNLDRRWQPWLGCWTGDAGVATLDWTKGTHVCVVPAGATSVDLVTISDNAMVSRERIDADGARHPDAQCPGSYVANWSATGRQLFVQATAKCDGRESFSASRIMTMTPAGVWLEVMSASSGASAGVRTVHYRAGLGLSPALPAGIIATLQAQTVAIVRARTAAAAPLEVADVVDAARHTDAAAIQGWLVAAGQPFALSSKSLTVLADAKVPSSVIDMMVALTFPETFSLQAQSVTRRAPAARASSSGGGTGCYSATGLAAIDSINCGWMYSPYWANQFGNGMICMPMAGVPTGLLRCTRGLMGLYGDYGYAGNPYGYYSLYGLLPGETWYVGQSPFVVTPTGGGAAPGPTPGHGRVVNGRGYSQGGAESSGQPVAANTPAASVPASVPQSSGAESAPASVPASSSGGERTAHPR